MEFPEKREKFADMDDDQTSMFVPEEILTEILLRLHIRPLFRFKLVAKGWNSIISNPTFGKNYLQRAGSSSNSSSNLSGILYPNYGPSYPNGLPRKSTDIDDAPPSLYLPTFSQSTQLILASSSGLILTLLRDNVAYSSTPDEFWVSNPLTKQSVKLPPFCVPRGSGLVFGFATRAGQPPHQNPTYVTYKVVVIRRVSKHPCLADSNYSTIMIFSSDNGRWTCKKRIACPKVLFSIMREKHYACNGILHWFDWNSMNIITYDPYDNSDSFGRIELPSGSGNSLRNSFKNLIDLGHKDLLKYVGIDRKLPVWCLVDSDKGEWCLEQRCVVTPRVLPIGLFLDCRRLIPRDPGNGDFYCCLIGTTHKDKAIDLIRSTDKEVYSEMVGVRSYANPNRLVPIALCPWSSPFYARIGFRTRSHSSPEIGFVNIHTLWLTSAI